MSDKEKTLSEYIDSLNSERRPKQHEQGVDSLELEELMDTVRMVKSLKEPELPDLNYSKKIAKAVADKSSHTRGTRSSKRAWHIGFGTVAAAIIMIFVLNLAFSKNNIVYAMEQAFQGVKAYHGILEITEANGEDKAIMQAKREVWANKEGHYYIEEIEGYHKGLITVNNGEKKWQLQSDSKQAYIFSAFPDPYRFTFELGKEVENVKNAIETKVVGEEQVGGRKALMLEVSPKGGDVYKLWIDKETKLPLKKQSAMQNALQYTITYTNIDFIDSIPEELVAYNLPADFTEINTNREQLVNNMKEAEDLAGFAVKVPEGIAAAYKLDSVTVVQDKSIVKLYYTSVDKQRRVVILQGKATEEFKPTTTAILGKINDSIAEVQSPVEGSSGILAGGGAYAGVTDISSIRWQDGGFEYGIVGNETIDALNMFVKGIAKADIQISQDGVNIPNKPEVEVDVDLAIEENEQKSVDAGHTPWKLDPAFVAQIFVSLKISPEGIQGEYPVQYEDFKMEQNTGKEAILMVQDDKSPISKVYLKKLVRQDNTGVWTVVGYDVVRK